jgi:hypothetical protein
MLFFAWLCCKSQPEGRNPIKNGQREAHSRAGGHTSACTEQPTQNNSTAPKTIWSNAQFLMKLAPNIDLGLVPPPVRQCDEARSLSLCGTPIDAALLQLREQLAGIRRVEKLAIK